MSKKPDQKVQQQTEVFQARVMDGLQVRSDGIQASKGGNQILMEGLQRVQRHAITGIQPKVNGQQAGQSVTPVKAFTPATGPKIPAKK
ncbi:hypothetical protein [Erwinia billingiae]|uniref:hypothetical protein n=1 Tax=Erwinia billingiae TaxID=182337 RepID=UPI00320A5B72